jgi:hypothetical protein
LAPNYYPALKTPYYHTKPPISRSRMILSVLGYFSFSISFKYDFDKSVIKPNKDKFLFVRACLSFSQKSAWYNPFLCSYFKDTSKLTSKNLFSIFSVRSLFCKTFVLQCWIIKYSYQKIKCFIK